MLKTGLYFYSLILLVCLLGGCGSKEKDGRQIILSGEVETEKPVQQDRKDQNTPPDTTRIVVRNIKVRNIGSLARVFNDSNYLHLAVAKQLGIDPLAELDSYYFMKRPIVKIEENEYFKIDTLTHSIPYLVPEAANLLLDIGKNFRDSLENRGGDSHLIKVTSLLRTPETVGRLRRVNINATDSSTHQYATTFDISYTKFYCSDERRRISDGDLKNLLAEVLNDLREAGRCYVKFERKTGCFHVTARK